MLPRDTVEEYWDYDTLNKVTELSSNNSVRYFRNEFSDYIGCEPDNLIFLNTARSGIEYILKAKKDNAKGKYVLTCGFNCSVVQSAIENAGYTLLLFDFETENGKVNWSQVADMVSKDIAAIIVTHFFGVPTDFREIIKKCRQHNILIIEDCAHTLGGYIGSSMAGTIGDASVFSFNYDKPISLAWGGAVVINDTSKINVSKLSDDEQVNSDVDRECVLDFMTRMTNRRKQIPREGLFYFRVIKKLGFIASSSFEIPTNKGIGPIRAELGRWCLRRYTEILKIRNKNAETISKLACNYSTWHVDDNVKPAWLKQKIGGVEEKQILRQASKIRRAGIRVGNYNWSTLIVGNGADLRNALITSRKWVDIPIHQRISEDDIKYMIDILNCSGCN